MFDRVTGLARGMLTFRSTPAASAAGGSIKNGDPMAPNYLFLGSFWHAMVAERGMLPPDSAQAITEEPAEFLASLTRVSARLVSEPDAFAGRSALQEFAAAINSAQSAVDGLRALCRTNQGYFAQRRQKAGLRECDDALGMLPPT